MAKTRSPKPSPTEPAGPTRQRATGPGAAAAAPGLPDDAVGRSRVFVEDLSLEIDGGRHAAKCVVGDRVPVVATMYADGHDVLSAVLRWKREGEADWREAPMALGNRDRWLATFPATEVGRYRVSVVAWVDHFRTWQRDLKKKFAAGQDIDADLEIGARLVDALRANAAGEDARLLEAFARRIRSAEAQEVRVAAALDPELDALSRRHDPRHFAVTHPREPVVVCDPVRARFSAWYELFPRSWGPEGRHGTFRDVAGKLDYVAGLGFDVLYFPPIHPVGRTARKGPNNRAEAEPGDPGSPWAIGSDEGGHKAVHPELGTLEDFRELVRRARDEHGLDVALDIAFQCSPDHPYVREHPEWFRHRPDGTIQYAENPPKKYQDIYPFDFECEAWAPLWAELKSVFDFWIEQGVRIFRVDNPHTKSLRFWEWCIDAVKREHPEVIFLSEAFTRPAPMKGLAKLGFTQSYTYFAWKNTKRDIEEWWEEFGQGEATRYYRPNLWPNTPDILNAYLQHGGRGAFMSRLILAGTLGASYGIYGPAFELQEAVPREPGSEEYRDSEKYQLRHWDLNRHDSLRPLVTRLNRIRRENPALQSNEGFAFHPVDNEQLICFSKRTPDASNVIVVVVNLDPFHRQSGWIELPLDAFGLSPERPYQLHDLISDARYLWQGTHGYVEVDPHLVSGHVFRLHRYVRTEEDFEYYL